MTRKTADLDAALRHEGALRRLAAALCRDAADADDAVQHAMVQAALGRRPRASPLRAFLRAAVRNHARNLHKLGWRRRQREARVAAAAAAAADGAPPTDELVAREQLRRRVAAAVLALEEPYRTTVWLRWFEGFDVAAVAARTEVPVNTVRTRLQRAHAQLRGRLDRAYGDRGWSVSAAPLAAPAAGGAASAGLAVIAGGLVVKQAVTMTVAVAAVLCTVLWWPDPEAAAPAEGAAADAAAVAAIAADPDLVRQRALAPPQADDRPPPAVAAPVPGELTAEQLAGFAAPAAPGTIEGIVLDGDGPVAGGRAWLGRADLGDADAVGLPWGGPAAWDAAAGLRRAAVGGDGTFRFAALPPGRYAVGVETPTGASRHAYHDLPASAAATGRIRFAFGGSTLRGRAFDDHGAPASGWQVCAYIVGEKPAGVQVITGTVAAADGNFEIGGLMAGVYRVGASPTALFNDERAQFAIVTVLVGAVCEVVVGSDATACEWTGRVLLPHGSPLGLAALTQLALFDGNRRTEHDVGVDGTFGVRCAPGSYSVQVCPFGTPAVELGFVELGTGALVRDLTVPGGVVCVRPDFVAATGQPQWPRTALRAVLQRQGGAARLQSVRGTDGREWFFAVSPGDYRLTCWPHPVAGAGGDGMAVTVTARQPQLEVAVTVQER